MNELLQQRIQAVQIGRNTTFAQMEQKKSLRDELESELERFLANGGVVTALKGTEFKERPPRVIHGEDAVYASRQEFLRILRWTQDDYAAQRRTALSLVTGIELKRVRSVITTNARGAKMHKQEYKAFKAAMPIIEEMERNNEKAQ